MALELRPSWCLDDEDVRRVLDVGPWLDAKGVGLAEQDGDDWTPGQGVTLTRHVVAAVEGGDLRKQLGLRAGAAVGLAARWYCRATGMSGTHVGGPQPIPLNDELTVIVEVPSSIGGSVDLEMSLAAVGVPAVEGVGGAPGGGVLWSDGWSVSAADRTLLLEGEELRIPVRTVSFKQRFGGVHGALWAIDVEPGLDAEELVSNAVTVLLNQDVIDRDFPGEEEPDLTLLPAMALAGISSDLVRALTGALIDELDDGGDWRELPAGTVGAILGFRLVQAFGSLASARAAFADDQAGFALALWDTFAPDRWRP